MSLASNALEGAGGFWKYSAKIVRILLLIPSFLGFALLVSLSLAGQVDFGFWAVGVLYYGFMLAVSFSLFFLIEQKVREIDWLLLRLFLPLGLAGLAELSFTLKADLLGYVLAFVVVLASFWLSLSSLVELVGRFLLWLFRSTEVRSYPRLVRWIFGLIDRFYRKEMLIRLPAGETLELVVQRHPLYVFEEVAKRTSLAVRLGYVGLILPVFLGLIAAVLGLFERFEALLFHGGSWGDFFGVFDVLVYAPLAGEVLMFLGVLTPLFVQYVGSLWNLLNSGAIIYRTMLVIAGLELPWGRQYSATGDTERLHEIRIDSPGEPIGGQSRSVLGKLFDGYLQTFSNLGISIMWFPVVPTARADVQVVDYVARASNIRSIIHTISRWGKELEHLVPGRRVTEVMTDPARAASALSFSPMPSAEGDAETLYRHYLTKLAEAVGLPVEQVVREFGEGGRVVDLMQVLRQGDPGRWDIEKMRPNFSSYPMNLLIE